MKTIIKIIVAAMVGLFLAAWSDEHHVGYRYGFVAVYFFGSIVVYYAIEGIISMWRKRNSKMHYDTIKFRKGMDYKQAAVFIGTACLYLGTQQQCDELCDDLWHHGQQAHVQVLDGNETFDIL